MMVQAKQMFCQRLIATAVCVSVYIVPPYLSLSITPQERSSQHRNGRCRKYFIDRQAQARGFTLGTRLVKGEKVSVVDLPREYGIQRHAGVQRRQPKNASRVEELKLS